MTILTDYMKTWQHAWKGDRCGGRAQGQQGFEARRRCHHWQSRRSPASISTGAQVLECSSFLVFKFSNAQVLKCSHSGLQQLFFLQTLNNISAENNSTIVFPVPVDIMATFMQNMSFSRAPTPAQVLTRFQHYKWWFKIELFMINKKVCISCKINTSNYRMARPCNGDLSICLKNSPRCFYRLHLICPSLHLVGQFQDRQETRHKRQD